MKFLQYLALLGVASAVKVESRPKPNLLTKVKAAWLDELDDDQAQEFKDWLVYELTDGHMNSITKPEFHDQLINFEEWHNLPPMSARAWVALDREYDAIDSNSDGEVTIKEFLERYLQI